MPPPTRFCPRPPRRSSQAIDAWWRANNYLTIGQIYLKSNPLLQRAADRRRHQAAAARSLGHQPGAVVRLRPCQPADQAHRPGVHLHHRPRPRRSRAGGGRLPGGHLHRDLPGDQPGHGRHPAAVPAVLRPGRHPQPRLGDHARLDPRGWRARVRAGARLRLGDGQPGRAGHHDGRRRRGRDRSAGRVVEGHLLSSTRPGTAPCCRSCTSTARRSPDPTVLGRKPDTEVRSLLEGHGYDVLEVSGDDLPGMHHRFAAALAEAYAKIQSIQADARAAGKIEHRPHWPMIILRSPKGWTGPKEIDGVKVDRHLAQPPGPAVRGPGQPRAPADPAGVDEVLPAGGAVRRRRSGPSSWCWRPTPRVTLRMSASPHANGGLLTDDLDLPDFRDFAVELTDPGTAVESTRRMGEMIGRDLPPQPEHLPAVLPRRDELQPAGRRLRRLRPGLHGDGHRRGREALLRRPGDGGAQRAQLPRLAGGLHADRPARAVRHLRGVRHGQRLADHPAQQVAGGGQRTCRGGPRCRA